MVTLVIDCTVDVAESSELQNQLCKLDAVYKSICSLSGSNYTANQSDILIGLRPCLLDEGYSFLYKLSSKLTV